MRVLVCVKRVPNPGTKIVLTEDRQDIDTRHLGFAMSPHEECAVEEAVQIVEREGGTATVMTLGPPEADEQLRYAVSLGVAESVLLETDGSDWDPMATARALTDAIREIEERDGGFDLILFGNESADSGGYQVGIRVSHALGRPCVNGVKNLELAEGPSGGSVTARRQTDEGFEQYELETPAVLGLKEGINLPRYPTMKGRLNARKHESQRMAPVAQPGGQAKLLLLDPPEQVSNTEILGTGAGAAPLVAGLIENLGLL